VKDLRAEKSRYPKAQMRNYISIEADEKHRELITEVSQLISVLGS